MPALRWWQQGVIYQLLVPSFQDSNGDGFGDLQGILDRLDHLEWLGIGAIWLSPIYASPMAELGYDVSDFTAINPQFGSLDLFDQVLEAAHARDIKVILDWVPNHSSDEHPWFQESKSSRDNPKRDWYLWHDARPDGSPPNNWVSVFGGSVWHWDPHTEQFYYHTFLEKQPDLNLRNPDVQQAIYDAMRFWLRRGVDGFRLDALCLLMKHAEFRDNPPNPNYRPEADGPDEAVLPQYTRDQPEVHDIVAAMRRIVDEFGDRVLLGELYLPPERVVSYYGLEQPQLHLPLNMRFAWTEWNAEKVGAVISQYRVLLPEGAWPAWTISTHDCLRVAFRMSQSQARVAAMLLMTIQGTPTLYYGEEIGMKGVDIPAERAIDPQGQRTGRNRDPERTPMQWNDGPNAGFTAGSPWLPLEEHFEAANVAAQQADERSLLHLYRRLIALRRDEPALLQGTFEVIGADPPLLLYASRGPDRRLLIVLNFSQEEKTYALPDQQHGRILISTFLDREGEEVQELHLRADEGVVLVI